MRNLNIQILTMRQTAYDWTNTLYEILPQKKSEQSDSKGRIRTLGYIYQKTLRVMSELFPKKAIFVYHHLAGAISCQA